MNQRAYECPACSTRSLALMSRDSDSVGLRCSRCGNEVRLPRDLWDLFCEKPGDSLPDFLALVKALNYYDLE
ncbi:MAG: hypothetical protein QCH35_00325 [Methanomicrobiaceae archaeon]|nr:hypothetical protein [Methanomicrobiaceae archaeon]